MTTKAVERETKHIDRDNDIKNLFILIFIASVLGIYLITTTVVISKDGVMYIELAKVFSTEPMHVIKERFFGYSLLIFTAHKLALACGTGSSVLTWTYAAQSITLLCRILALIPLYFIGKRLVGSRWSFWAIFILIILPYPAEFGSDVLRDWPHILFLAAGFLCLLWGAEYGKWWMFAGAGLAAGFGHMIRPECAQLVVYGAAWILVRLFAPRHNMNRRELLYALIVLFIGFAVPAGPYMKARGRILPEKVKVYINASAGWESKNAPESDTENGLNVSAASSLPGGIVKAIGKIAGEMSDNLMYYFVPPLVIGALMRIRRRSAIKNIEKFFIPAFICVNVAMMIILYDAYQYLSRRHCLPLVVFLIFYVPTGLNIQAQWLRDRFSKSRSQTNRQLRGWFFALLVVGVGICMPKLLRPIGVDKWGLRAAATWLKENTGPEDVIAVTDSRITFYAERKGLTYTTEAPKEAGYVVRITKDESEGKDVGGMGQEQYSVQVDKRRKDTKRLRIYKTP
ncbi:glycosyltransferase family 39 protein [Planctomycetota bacterium]